MQTLKLANKSIGHQFPPCLLIWIAALFLVNCTGKEPIHVGFVAQLTGVQAELGVQERNGAQLAVAEINAAGGVAGRSIELIIKDDLGTPEGAQAADRELIKAGVVAIIGHATSAQTIAGLAVSNPAHVVMLSPTTSTSELSGQDDYFFRIAETVVARAHQLSRRVYQGRHINRIAVIYDTDNTAYAKAYLEAFADKFQSLGGTLVSKTDFSSKAKPNFTPLLTQLRASNPNGLLIIAADIDTALIAQRTRLMGWPIPLFTTSWAQTETLIHNGGRAVEGLELEVNSTLTSQTPDYLDFVARYQNKFGRVPSFGGILGYEAAKVLAIALQKTGGKAEGLVQALIGIKNFKGLSEIYAFDKYGDVVRPDRLGVIRNGKYADIEAVKPTEP
jgi:branched-chain amino acid transport system substrate-binding protein